MTSSFSSLSSSSSFFRNIHISSLLLCFLSCLNHLWFSALYLLLLFIFPLPSSSSPVLFPFFLSSFSLAVHPQPACLAKHWEYWDCWVGLCCCRCLFLPPQRREYLFIAPNMTSTAAKYEDEPASTVEPSAKYYRDMTKTPEKQDKNMSKTRQKHVRNMTETQQKHVDNMFLLFS